jgi:hypothetical protein
MVDNNNSLGED